MKHFIMVKAPSYRTDKYLLLTTNGDEFVPFQLTLKNMSRQNYAANTIEQYAGHIARFIDYIYEASRYTDLITPEFILDVVDSYKSYLLFGIDAEEDLPKKIAAELRPNRTTAGSSLLPIGAAIKYFLTLSDAKALAKNEDMIFSKMSHPKLRKLSPAEQAQMKKNNMLAGVIRSGVQYTKKSKSLFGKSIRGNSKFKRIPMPFDKVGELIAAAPSYREKTLYSFLAASGCRTHEALQIRLCDIDFENREVFLNDPSKRDRAGLTEKEYKQLAWKGRAACETFLIEPFKSAFFENLKCYIKKERIAHGKHDFVFQKRGGRPYFTTSRQTRTEAFKKLRDRIGLVGQMQITVHSLRHMYGIYTLNYLPLSEQFGLPISIVRLLMGHVSILSTECYAKNDKDLVKAKIEYANQMVYGKDGKRTLNEIIMSYHEFEVKRLKSLEQQSLPQKDFSND